MFPFYSSVPLVPLDGSPSVCLSSCLSSLSVLSSVLDDCFLRLSSRLSHHHESLQSINTRLIVAQQKVTQISENSSRVTTIFSSAKYPSIPVSSVGRYKKVFSSSSLALDLNQLRVMMSSPSSRLMLDELPYIPPSSCTPPLSIPKDALNSTSLPCDTSSLFNSLSKCRIKRIERVCDETQEGLGPLPGYLPSVSSVVLFNSDENPYKHYNTINNLEGVGGKDRANNNDFGPSAAPQSLIEGAILPSFAGYQFEYKPLLGELPTFSLPENLPLGNLANINFGKKRKEKNRTKHKSQTQLLTHLIFSIIFIFVLFYCVRFSR